MSLSRPQHQQPTRSVRRAGILQSPVHSEVAADAAALHHSRLVVEAAASHHDRSVGVARACRRDPLPSVLPVAARSRHERISREALISVSPARDLSRNLVDYQSRKEADLRFSGSRSSQSSATQSYNNEQTPTPWGLLAKGRPANVTSANKGSRNKLSSLLRSSSVMSFSPPTSILAEALILPEPLKFPEPDEPRITFAPLSYSEPFTGNNRLLIEPTETAAAPIISRMVIDTLTRERLPAASSPKPPVSPIERDALGLEYEPDAGLSEFKPSTFRFESLVDGAAGEKGAELKFCSNNDDFYSGGTSSPLMRSMGSKLWACTEVIADYLLSNQHLL